MTSYFDVILHRTILYHTTSHHTTLTLHYTKSFYITLHRITQLSHSLLKPSSTPPTQLAGIFRPENEWTRQAHLENNLGAKAGNYTDGSIESDLPMQQLSELFNVNHFIVSQVIK